MKNSFVILVSVLLLVACTTNEVVHVKIENSTNLQRTGEMVEISYNEVAEKLKIESASELVITDKKNNPITYQVVDAQSDNPAIIFQADVPAGGIAEYQVVKGKSTTFTPKVYGRLVPERKDDFTWENDKIAFRIYGPALEQSGEVSNGMDVWAKRTNQLIIDKWYKQDLSGVASYHQDHGEGLDFYKVGSTLGAGATAPYEKDQLWFSKNFVSHQVIDNGPLRITVKFTYAPFTVAKRQVVEVRTISMDAGSQLNKISVVYDTEEDISIASGIVLRNLPDEEIYISDSKKIAAHAEPTDSLNGTLYEAIASITPYSSIENKHNHLLAFTTVQAGKPYTYFAGAGWSKAGFATFDDWKKYVQEFSLKQDNPLIVSIK